MPTRFRGRPVPRPCGAFQADGLCLDLQRLGLEFVDLIRAACGGEVRMLLGKGQLMTGGSGLDEQLLDSSGVGLSVSHGLRVPSGESVSLGAGLVEVLAHLPCLAQPVVEGQGLLGHALGHLGQGGDLLGGLVEEALDRHGPGLERADGLGAEESGGGVVHLLQASGDCPGVGNRGLERAGAFVDLPDGPACGLHVLAGGFGDRPEFGASTFGLLDGGGDLFLFRFGLGGGLQELAVGVGGAMGPLGDLFAQGLDGADESAQGDVLAGGLLGQFVKPGIGFVAIHVRLAEQCLADSEVSCYIAVQPKTALTFEISPKPSAYRTFGELS